MYDARQYDAEMRRFNDRLTALGVSVSSYLGYAIVEVPMYLGEDTMIIDHERNTVAVGSKHRFLWRITLATHRIEARRDLEKILAAAWARCGVDAPTEA